MKILIVTLEKCYSYGGILQVWALQNVLKKLGHESYKLDIKLPKGYPLNKKQVIWNFVKRIRRKYFVGDKNIRIFQEPYYNHPIYTPHHNFIIFLNKYISSNYVSSIKDIKENDYDAIIVGSDQVWRKLYVKDRKLLTSNTAADNAFLAFTKGWNCKRIAYAASFGVDYWEYDAKETIVLKSLINNFNAVSVREDSAISLIKNNLDSDLHIEHVLDPTLLIDKTEYIKLLKKHNIKKNINETLVFILDEDNNKEKIIEHIKSFTKSNIFFANNPHYSQWTLSPKQRVQPTITSWLHGFHDAKIVITDSYHACVFSIIFEKPFYVILNDTRGTTRIKSLLNIFGLSDRIVHDIKDIPNIDNNINWENIRKIKEKWQKNSLSFLKNSLTT